MAAAPSSRPQCLLYMILAVLMLAGANLCAAWVHPGQGIGTSVPTRDMMHLSDRLERRPIRRNHVTTSVTQGNPGAAEVKRGPGSESNPYIGGNITTYNYTDPEPAKGDLSTDLGGDFVIDLFAGKATSTANIGSHAPRISYRDEQSEYINPAQDNDDSSSGSGSGSGSAWTEHRRVFVLQHQHSGMMRRYAARITSSPPTAIARVTHNSMLDMLTRIVQFWYEPGRRRVVGLGLSYRGSNGWHLQFQSAGDRRVPVGLLRAVLEQLLSDFSLWNCADYEIYLYDETGLSSSSSSSSGPPATEPGTYIGVLHIFNDGTVQIQGLNTLIGPPPPPPSPTPPPLPSVPEPPTTTGNASIPANSSPTPPPDPENDPGDEDMPGTPTDRPIPPLYTPPSIMQQRQEVQARRRLFPGPRPFVYSHGFQHGRAGSDLPWWESVSPSRRPWWHSLGGSDGGL